jgi:carboxylesterase type B
MSIVATNLGRIEGEEIHIFRGIPFARAKRFRPPETIDPWPYDVRPARTFSAPAPQSPDLLDCM